MLKSALKKITPTSFKFFLIKILNYRPVFYLKYQFRKIKLGQEVLLKELKKKEIINVIFLVIHESIWKYDQIYRLLDNDPKFNVKIVIIPLVRRDQLGQMDTYYQTVNYFTDNGYNIVESYDKINNFWKDIKFLTKPDIVFFTNPHRLTFDKYYIYNFKNVLTCYVPYAFVVIHSIEMHYDQFIFKALWKYFLETNQHKVFARNYIKDFGSNLIVSGYPGLDNKFELGFKPKNVWKEYKIDKTYKIIWAPHHTISGQGSGLDYSSFMDYAHYFVELLSIKSNIQIAFKPHPLLKEKLYKDSKWGVEKTDKYYKYWNELPNGQLEEGPYVDLFHFSDAMIMDSASFIVEYLYFDKPIAFTKKDDEVLERFNTFGKKVFNYLYLIKSTEELDEFIDEIIINKNDYLKMTRNQFLNEKILPKNGKTASENIYNELLI